MLLTVTLKNSSILRECINRFLIPLWTNDSIILLVNFDGKFFQPVNRFTYGNELNSFEHIKPNIYVIQLGQADSRKILHYLEQNTFFNPKAQFILVTDKVQNDIFENLADVYIYEAVVMEEVMQDVINLYSYKPVYKKGHLDISFSPVKIGYCIGGIIRYNKTMSHYTIPIKRRSLPLKVGCSHSIPSMIMEGDIPTSGVDFELLKLISEKLQVQFQYIIVSDFVGRKDYKNYSFSGALGYLEKRKVDLLVGGVFPTWQGLSTFDFTHPTLASHYVWIVPAANKRPLWKSLIFTFSLTVWILYFIIFFTNLIILIFANKFVMEKSYNCVGELFMLYKMCLTASGPSLKFELGSKKLVYILWLLIVIIYSNCFSAKLLSNLMVKKYNNQITLMDFSSIDWKICIYTDLIEQMTMFGEERIITCIDCESCVNRTAFQRDLISVRSGAYVQSDIPRFYLNEDGESLIHFLDTVFMITHDGMIFRKNHPYFEDFNEIIVRLSVSGFVDKIIKKYAKRDDKLQRVVWQVLNMTVLSFIFQFLAYGLLLAFVVFIVEVTVSRKNLGIHWAKKKMSFNSNK